MSEDNIDMEEQKTTYVVEQVSEEAESEVVESQETVEGEPSVLPANAPDETKAKAILEGLLFIVGDEGLTVQQAAVALDIPESVAQSYLVSLQQSYQSEDKGIELCDYGGTYRFLTRSFVQDYAKRLFQISKQATLSQAALETLAIIAYKQPVTRVEIEEIRGVGADMMLRKLLARDLIKESGRSEAAGRPILYEVTDEFMNSFQLKTLKELPELPVFDDDNKNEELFNQ